jgi:Protein of unknown function (DUF3108)
MTKPGIINKPPSQKINHFLPRNWPFTRRVPANQHCIRRVALRFFAVIVVVFAGVESHSFPNDETRKLTRSAPWKPGESLQYRVSWANFVAAGELTLDCQEVSEPGKARLYRFGVRARSVDWVRTLFLNVNDSYESSVDAETLLPVQAKARLEHGNKLEQTSIRFDHQNKVARLSNGHTQPLAPNTYDAATFMFILRTFELGSGKTQVVRLLDQQTVHTLRVEPEGIESVRVGQKDYQVSRVAIKQVENGIAQDTLKIRLYLTSDPRRVPVLMTAEPAWGTIRVELRE